jgi:hypothetical protein
VRHRVIGLDRNRLLEQWERLIRKLRHRGEHQGQGAEIQVVRIQAVRTLALGPLDLRLA